MYRTGRITFFIMGNQTQDFWMYPVIKAEPLYTVLFISRLVCCTDQLKCLPCTASHYPKSLLYFYVSIKTTLFKIWKKENGSQLLVHLNGLVDCIFHEGYLNVFSLNNSLFGSSKMLLPMKYFNIQIWAKGIVGIMCNLNWELRESIP